MSSFIASDATHEVARDDAACDADKNNTIASRKSLTYGTFTEIDPS